MSDDAEQNLKKTFNTTVDFHILGQGDREWAVAYPRLSNNRNVKLILLMNPYLLYVVNFLLVVLCTSLPVAPI